MLTVFLDNNQIEESLFTGESALTPNRAGPTGDGLGPPILPGAAIPPPVPAVGIGGAAAGILPAPSPYDLFQTTQNPPTTVGCLIKLAIIIFVFITKSIVWWSVALLSRHNSGAVI